MSDEPTDSSIHDVWKLLVEIKTNLDNALKVKDDHEARIRVAEEKLQHTVSFKTLLAGLGGAAGAATAVGQFIQWVLHR